MPAHCSCTVFLKASATVLASFKHAARISYRGTDTVAMIMHAVCGIEILKIHLHIASKWLVAARQYANSAVVGKLMSILFPAQDPFPGARRAAVRQSWQSRSATPSHTRWRGPCWAASMRQPTAVRRRFPLTCRCSHTAPRTSHVRSAVIWNMSPHISSYIIVS